MAEVVDLLKQKKVFKLHKIQQYVVPMMLKTGKDIVAYSRTGRGKTCEFLSRPPYIFE